MKLTTRRQQEIPARFRRGGVNRIFKDGEEGAGGGGAPDWRQSLSPELREDPAFKDFKTLDAALKSHKELLGYRGRSIAIPADEKERVEFRQKLKEKVPELVDASDTGALAERYGVPKKPEEYSIQGLNLPDGVTITDDQLNALRAEALEDGVPRAGFAKRVSRGAAAIAAAQKAQREAVAGLKTEWGADFDSKMTLVKSIADQTNAPQEVKDGIASGNISKATASWMLGLAKSMGTQPREGATQQQGTEPKMTKVEANKKLKELITKSRDPKISSEDRADITEEMKKIAPFAFPEEAAEMARGG